MEMDTRVAMELNDYTARKSLDDNDEDGMSACDGDCDDDDYSLNRLDEDGVDIQL